MLSLIFFISVLLFLQMTIVIFVNNDYDVDAINCDNANLGANDQGHIRGNSHCSTGVEPKEPARDCGHKNSDKDNDGDTATICINRGN
jgi:hypothetical protein